MSSSPFDREHESYEPNYLTPGYETSASPADSDPTAPQAEPTRPARAAEPEHFDTPEPAEEGRALDVAAEWQEASVETTSGPDSSTSGAVSTSGPDFSTSGPDFSTSGPDSSTAGPDFSSAYESLDDEPAEPSVYDEGYVTPTPAPVVEAGYQDPGPTPVNLQSRPQPMPHPMVPMRPQNYGYGYHPHVVPYQQPYPLQPYPYSYGPVFPEHPSSTTVGVLGLASFAIWVTAPVAWYMGAKAKKEIARGAPYRLSGLAQFGYVVGIIYSVIGTLFFGLMMLGIMFG